MKEKLINPRNYRKVRNFFLRLNLGAMTVNCVVILLRAPVRESFAFKAAFLTLMGVGLVSIILLDIYGWRLKKNAG